MSWPTMLMSQPIAMLRRLIPCCSNVYISATQKASRILRRLRKIAGNILLAYGRRSAHAQALCTETTRHTSRLWRARGFILLDGY
jgi:hypothetical protein